MKYTVLWTPATEQDLAAIWIAASDRQAVTSAANLIDNLLGTDPETQGESRSGNVRILLAAPLGVDFEVLEEDRIVYVLTVWHYEPEWSRLMDK